MPIIGAIVRFQVQRDSLNVGKPPRRRYDPAPLRQVDALSLTEDGVRGWTADGDLVPDVHNRHHPASKNRDGLNGVSLIFTSHYDLMRERFGDHLDDGIAGENILIELADPARTVSEAELRNGVCIETAADGLIQLEDLIVAVPCVEFARYALRFPDEARPDRTVTEAVQALDNGVRGYYASFRGPETCLALGARVEIR